MKIDNIDFQILQILTKNSRIQWKDLGEQIHMTGQAVGNRIKKLEDNGVIKAYSLIVDEMKVGLSYTAFVIIYMNTSNHDSFIRHINDQDEVISAHRVSGDGCYHLNIKVSSQEKLNQLLNEFLEFGNYKLYLSIQEIKKQTPLKALV